MDLGSAGRRGMGLRTLCRRRRRRPWSLYRFGLLLLVFALEAPASLGAGSLTPTRFAYNGMKAGEGAMVCLQGASFVDERVQLTATGAVQGMGRCLFGEAVQLKGSSGEVLSFSTQFIFSILPGPSDLADGLAFVVAPSLDPVPASAQGLLGIVNEPFSSSAHTFAVEFDTYPNPEYQDKDNNHVGVDLNSVVSWLSASAYFKYHDIVRGASDGFQVTLKGLPVRAWIDYDGPRTQLNVSVSRNLTLKPPAPLISNSSLNLSDIFMDRMYVGFSASTGPLPDVLYYLHAWSFSNSGSSEDVFMPVDASNGSQALAVGLGVGLSVLALALLASGSAYWLVRKRRLAELQAIDLQMGSFALGDYLPREFTYTELSNATKGFAEKSKLGSGGFGSVYRGVLTSNGLSVAVKRIAKDSKQGVKEFVAEVSTIGRLRHRNLVPLMGWCKERGFMLVYELMPNGSLDKLLFCKQEGTGGGGGTRVLGWEERVNVVRGVANALLYLHEECENRVVHRDVKASNVLLDKEMNARLGDFGLARFHGHDVAPNTTNVAGTYGYMAPECFLTQKATDKSDVFSFGALLLEVVTGRRANSLIEEEDSTDDLCSLLPWLWRHHHKGTLHLAVDPALQGANEDMTRVLQLGLLCCHIDPTTRPPMRQVLAILGGDTLPPPLPPLPLPIAGSSAHLDLDLHLLDCQSSISIESLSAQHSQSSSFEQTTSLLQSAQ